MAADMRLFVLIVATLFWGCFAPVGDGPVESGGAGGGTGGAGGGSSGACHSDSECSKGMVCELCGETKSCAPGCRSNADCARPTTCQGPVLCKTCPCAARFCALDLCLDEDQDGFVAAPKGTLCALPAGDCDDHDARVNPGRTEVCRDGDDNDCDGLADEKDPDCDVAPRTCRSVFDCGKPGVLYCQLGFDIDGVCQSCAVNDGTCPPNSSLVNIGVDPLTACFIQDCLPDVGCPLTDDPVCSTRGVTYANPCELNRAKSTLMHPGECVPGEGLACDGHGAACEGSQALYCRDECPFCNLFSFVCSKVGSCIIDSDCPAGLSGPRPACQSPQQQAVHCVAHACQFTCE